MNRTLVSRYLGANPSRNCERALRHFLKATSHQLPFSSDMQNMTTNVAPLRHTFKLSVSHHASRPDAFWRSHSSNVGRPDPVLPWFVSSSAQMLCQYHKLHNCNFLPGMSNRAANRHVLDGAGSSRSGQFILNSFLKRGWRNISLRLANHTLHIRPIQTEVLTALLNKP